MYFSFRVIEIKYKHVFGHIIKQQFKTLVLTSNIKYNNIFLILSIYQKYEIFENSYFYI